MGNAMKEPAARILRMLAVALPALTASGAATAQTVFLCQDDGRSFAVLGEEGAPGCRPLADPETDLRLAPAQPDLSDVMRQLSAQSARIDRLEQLLLGRRPSLAPRPRPLTQGDTFDTRGRTRDLGQDLERRLDELSR